MLYCMYCSVVLWLLWRWLIKIAQGEPQIKEGVKLIHVEARTSDRQEISSHRGNPPPPNPATTHFFLGL